MKKNFIIKIMMSIFTLILINPELVFADTKISELDDLSKSRLKETKLGIGGGGALFEPAISPFNSNDMLVVLDMEVFIFLITKVKSGIE